MSGSGDGKVMSPDEHIAFLKSLGACPEAIEYATGKTLRAWWRGCTNAMWLWRLASKMCGKPGWPTKDQMESTYSAFIHARAPFIRFEEQAALIRHLIGEFPAIQEPQKEK